MERSKKVMLQATCPSCKKFVEYETTFTADPLLLVPPVRGKIIPTEDIPVYKFTSNDLKKFITDKTREYVPNAKVEVVPLYCEKKGQKNSEPHHSYATLRVGFSTDVAEKNEDMGWYGKIGKSKTNVRLVDEIWKNLIKRYRYDREKVDKWLESYKILENLEDDLGMSEAYIKEIQKYIIPKRVEVNKEGQGSTEEWIFFSAMTERVIRDFLSNPETDEVYGRMKIIDVYPIMKGVVQWIVYLYPHEIDSEDNPIVRQIMMGDKKK